jgi:hypothetical protein
LFYGNGIQKEMLKSNSLSGGNVLNNFFGGYCHLFSHPSSKGAQTFSSAPRGIFEEKNIDQRNKRNDKMTK